VTKLGRWVAADLVHLPGKPAGVGDKQGVVLAAELLHLPGQPAGVEQEFT
jgi:hypothetical protein